MFFNKLCVVVAVGGLLGSFTLAEKRQRTVPIGQVTTNAVVDNTPVPAGTTVFAGAVISTQARGAVIHLSNGESVELAPDSAVSFKSEGTGALRMGVRSGQAKVRTAGGRVVSALQDEEAVYSSKQGWSHTGASITAPSQGTASFNGSPAAGDGELETLEGSKAGGEEDAAVVSGPKRGGQAESLGKNSSGRKKSPHAKQDAKPSKRKPGYNDDSDEDESEQVASPTRAARKSKKK